MLLNFRSVWVKAEGVVMHHNADGVLASAGTTGKHSIRQLPTMFVWILDK
jgi:hypothetical protein